jgi:hypothetical protein
MDASIPNEILEKSLEAVGTLVPIKSAARYDNEFQQFCEWKNKNNVTQVTEEVMLAYMLDLVSTFYS